jgi:hypothetical protein
MLADFFAKPPQGVLFLKYCYVMMGYKHTSTLLSSLSAHEELVGINEHDSTKVKTPTQSTK